MHPEPVSEEALPDLTWESLELPAARALRLQAPARGDEGFLLGLAYSTQRGYARSHAFVGELRQGAMTVEVKIPELGFAIKLGEVTLTKCETVNQLAGSRTEPAQFTRGYGLSFGRAERCALAMALVDRALMARELGEGGGVRAGRGVRPVPLRQRPGRGVPGAHQAAPLRRLPVRAAAGAQAPARGGRRGRRTPRGRGATGGYAFAYLDEDTKRMIRRAILKDLVIPGYQVLFASREMPMPYGWAPAACRCRPR